ncbi:MAG: hypothetical protein KDD82_08740, partial [Planctomycetes bacterium]|nr:hypothetical protein [Planctomycetota bacterium]
SNPPPPGPAPTLLGVHYYDTDGSGGVSAGDQVALSFDVSIQLNGADPARDLVFVTGDTPGAGATLSGGATASVVSLTLGTAPQLSVLGTYQVGVGPGPGLTPATLGLSAAALPTAFTNVNGGTPARLGDPPLRVYLGDPASVPAYQGVAYTAPAAAAATVYRGNLHAHTGYSADTSGAGTLPPSGAWTYARDTAMIDLMAVTDHLDNLDATEWANTQTQAAGEQRATFVALTGFEWNHGRVTPGGQYINHCNVIGALTAPLTIADTDTLAEFYAHCVSVQYPVGAVGQFNHPSFSDNNGLDRWNNLAYDAPADKFMALITCMGTGNQDRPDRGYDPALDNGWHVSPTSNQDNHTGLWGDKTGRRTGVWVDVLNVPNVLKALREGRVFSSSDTDASARMFANVTGWMGSTITGPGAVNLTVEWADGGGQAASNLKIYTNGGAVAVDQAITGAAGSATVTVNPTVDSWFYALVTQADGSSIFTAPIYVDR